MTEIPAHPWLRSSTPAQPDLELRRERDRIKDAIHPDPAGTHPEPEVLEFTPDDLEPEQKIRAEALDAAVRIADRAEMPDDWTVRDQEALVIGTAERLADWISDGTYDFLADLRDGSTGART